MQTLAQSLYLMGVGNSYVDYQGQQQQFDQALRVKVLEAMGVDVDNLDALAALNYQLDAAPWQQLCDDIMVISEPSPRLVIRLSEVQFQRQQSASLHLEVNAQHANWCISQGQFTGDYVIDGCRYLALSYELGQGWLAPGFYTARVSVAEHSTELELWWAPQHVYQGAYGQQGAVKSVGLSCGLYTLVSEHGVGMGDFADLKALLREAAALSIDYVLLNPLHLLDCNDASRHSPYSPSSRMLIHPLYIAVQDSPECDAAILAQLNEAKRHYSNVASAPWLDYEQVYALKLPLLRALFERFCTTASTERKAEFAQFKEQHRVALDTLDDSGDEQACYWQWQAWLQRQECQNIAQEAGMKLGLINDLAVGVSDDGGEFNRYRALFTPHACIGAPPDDFAPQGQNWGMPALLPQAMKRHRFAYAKALFSANMQEAGALRIDHVMALMRIWWCVDEQGCYVYYPFDELLALIKILSHQHRCVVIGEDLGVVPEQVRQALAQAQIFSNAVYYFCYQNSAFSAPQHLDEHTLLMISNHDLPPFAQWWQGDDLNQALQLALISAEQKQSLYEQRQNHKSALIERLTQPGESVSLHSTSADVYRALCRALAQGSSKLLTLQLDDLDGQHAPVNIPGTHREYPNWRRQLSQSAVAILQQQQQFICELTRSRHGTCDD
ncbi:4-alpha-glucanotransferase [Pseudoalteromonas sp. MM17-2]|uniref:4-alpha-glucanotransferase n=1 Tax=Pseudoalteromonas sp. MM17-2 TaxID=2917753 RepID=UPI001EF5241E|nr:4-alpha-glucanotransferase [Pseudoalteromonas sp. MM17-2]MCG7542739.1 4-alpha-glucanotransferase [Pseudoalteromonas sp. MM17-2]